MSLMLEEFYRHLSVVGVSSMTGDGVEDFFKAVEEKRQEFERDYKPELERKQKEREDSKASKREMELGKLMKDMSVSGSSRQRRAEDNEPETVSEAEEEEEAEAGAADDDDDDDDGDDSDGEAAPRAEQDDGLAQRYREALSDSQKPLSDQDLSFTRYLRANNINP